MKIEWLVARNCAGRPPRGPRGQWSRGTRDIVTEFQVIAQIYRVIHSGFVSQKLLQVAITYLSILHTRSAQNIQNGV